MGGGGLARHDHPNREPPDNPPPPEDQICSIVTPMTHPTLLGSTFYRKFMIVGTTNGEDTGGYSFVLSEDLVHWGDYYLIRKGNPWNATYNEIYPSFIDVDGSTSNNFETVGQSGYLYYIVSRGQTAQGALIRDVLRQPVSFGGV